jgi:hypothetical protein
MRYPNLVTIGHVPTESGRCKEKRAQAKNEFPIRHVLNFRWIAPSAGLGIKLNSAEMIRPLFAILVCVVTSSQATAQNKVSQALLGLSEDERNETFTDLLRDGNVKCDRVTHTLFNGATSDLDVWEVVCRDRNSYSLTVPSGPNADIELVTCRELLATSKMLLVRAGSKTKAPTTRMHRQHSDRARRMSLLFSLDFRKKIGPPDFKKST